MIIIDKFNDLKSLQEYYDLILNEEHVIPQYYSEHTFGAFLALSSCLTLLQNFSADEITEEFFNEAVESLFNTHGSIYGVENFEELKKLYFELKESSEEIYIYPFSKTIFKNRLNTNLIPSLYNKFFKYLKNKEIIVSATGSYVLLAKYSFTEEDLLALQEVDFKSGETLSELSTFIENIVNDNTFYKNAIEKLELQIRTLIKQHEQDEAKLLNKTLSTWY